MNDTGQKIKNARRAKKLTQKELGDLVGIHVNTIRKYEKNYRIPTIEIIEKIADALEIPVSLLMSDADKWKKPGNKRLSQKPENVSEIEATLCIVKLLDYAGLDVALSTKEIKRITKITKDLHKSLIEDIKLNSDYTIID